MTAFIEIRPCDIISTTYKTYPSQTSIVLNEGVDDTQYISKNYFLDTDMEFTPGLERNLFDSTGGYRTGSYNLSGTIILLRNHALTAGEKRSINRLRNIYADVNFVRPQNYTSSSVFSASLPEDQYMTILNIPSILYGTEIKPGSFQLELGANLTLVDDGYGGVLSSSVVIGSIFYQHGIVMLGHHSQDPSVLDGHDGSLLHFSGTHIIPMTMYVCRSPKGMLNFSQNDSFTVFNTASNKYEITTKTNKTFVTTVGLYDEDYELLAVAKVAKPILNEEDGSIQFRLRLNY